MQDQKNMILAIVLSLGLIIVVQLAFETFGLNPPPPPQEEIVLEDGTVSTAPSAPGTAPTAGVGGALTTQQLAQITEESRDAAIRSSERIEIRSNRVTGSLALKGARIDDIVLNDYRQTVAEDSDLIQLFSPSNTRFAYYAEHGWISAAGDVPVPTPETVWTADRDTLTPETPVTLSWDNGQGLVFERRLAMDEDFMFTVTQTVRNTGDQRATLYPYGLISRAGTPPVSGFFILHEGLIGVLQETLVEHDYDDLQDEPRGTIEDTTTGGWIGITDKYWLAALALAPDQRADTRFVHTLTNGRDRYQTDIRGGAFEVAPGAEATFESRVFAGAKEVHLLDRYSEELGITNFDLAVDFGWLFFLTKPFFYALDFFYRAVGNFGVAILIFTVLIKLVFFPLANKSYKAMSKMKELQPKMVALREKFGEDKQRLNQEMMNLYKTEKVNPAAGCLPILVQIPVFFALYKVLFVTIEMRHQPFYGWIQDLSAPDPTTMFNLFGLIPWDPPTFLMIGIWPLIMGATMYMQQKLNPPPPDPMQQKIFMALPFVFTFLLASFPAGLVIYWAWNNALSILQQYVIMRRMGVAIGGGKATS
ncbi:MAG: membrane protein insertase YidC [Alphaproteobacteria bacterium]|nr:membrane protein insertase YidC [Alphaproteobacteria bacterium]